jgi:hypothetical protein
LATPAQIDVADTNLTVQLRGRHALQRPAQRLQVGQQQRQCHHQHEQCESEPCPHRMAAGKAEVRRSGHESLAVD